MQRLSEWALLGFSFWTLGLLMVTVGTYRWFHIFGGTRAIHTFAADGADGAAWYRRGVRAHANCIENLPVFGALVFLSSQCASVPTAFETLAVTVALARVPQGLIHILFVETARTVSLRFAFYSIQVFGMLGMGALLI